MFELQRSSQFFEQMASAHPTIVQNIEIVHENKTALDVSYHQPKHFILGLNNLLRSLLFFIELSNKNAPDWLKKAVGSFIATNDDDYQKFRYLTNVSAHQKLVFPEESLVSGLYRIRSSRNYTLKLGFGDHNKPGKYAWEWKWGQTRLLLCPTEQAAEWATAVRPCPRGFDDSPRETLVTRLLSAWARCALPTLHWV